MRRVRSNLDDILIPRLRKIGYEFGYRWLESEDPEFGQRQDPVRTLPLPDISQLLDDFEQKRGPIPLSIRAFYQEVGGVNLTGFLPKRLFVLMPDGTPCLFFEVDTGRGYQGPDPLCVYGPGGPDFFDAVIAFNDGELPIALDSFHKINVSGGGGYDIHLPDAVADAKLVGEWHDTTFINYLRICFACAGLPGLEGLHFFTKKEQKYLSKNLLPF
jgi:hypothetical protein